MTRFFRVTRAVVAGSLAALTFAACADQDASSLTGVRSFPAKLEHAPTLAAQIDALINTVIPPAYRPNIQSWWDGIKRKVANKDARAAQSLVDLTFIIQKLTPKLTPPPGQSQEDAAAQLVLLMGLYVHNGPETPPPPPVTEQSDATLALVSPTSTQDQTVQTESEQAAVSFPPGAVSVPTIVVITRIDPSQYAEECSGPLPTQRCQYPPFYKFDVFPDVRLNTPAIVGVCRLETDEIRVPRADHDRFRLAHNRPTDPGAFHPEGTIEGEIEILPREDASHLINCPDEEEVGGGFAVVPPDASLLERVAIRTRFQAGRAARAVGKFVMPRPLYAIDRGGGGAVLMFSDFAMVDPQSQPDLYNAGYFSASLSSALPGTSISVHADDFTNDGTGPAVAFTNQIVIADNPGLAGEGAHVLASIAEAPMSPEVHRSISADVTIPEGLAPGTYWIGVRLDANNANLELNEANNVASTMITVTSPETDNALVLCPPAGGGGDFITRGFYVPNYPGTTLSKVELWFMSFSPQVHQITLTARANAYDGPVIGTTTVTVSIPGDLALAPATFNFGNLPAPPGSVVTFAMQSTNGTPFYNVLTTNPSCPVIETAGTTPPLDTFRRNGIAVRITGEGLPENW